MSYTSEHRKMRPVLKMAGALSIAANPAPQAIYEDGAAGFQIWCTRDDQPAGWESVPLDQGTFSKHCGFVASVGWGWEDETITHLRLETAAYKLRDHRPDVYHGYASGYSPIYADQQRRSIFNRAEDIRWAQAKIRWLFEKADVPCPPIQTREF